MIQRAEGVLYAGSLNQVNLLTPYVQASFYLDLWGLKYTFFNGLIKYNTVDHQFCSFAEWLLEVAKGEFYAEILVNECIWGLVSYFDNSESAITCTWREYAIQDPIFQKNLSDYKK